MRKRSSRSGDGRAALAGLLVFALLPVAGAQSHTTFQGLGEFASGFLHPLTTPPHLLALLALGLWLGQQTPLRIREPAAALAISAGAGLLATASGHFGGIYLPALVAVTLCIGGFVALSLPLPPWTRWAGSAVVGLMLGLDSGVDAGVTGAAMAKTLAATWASLTLCAANVAFYVSLLPPARWAQTGIRVAGSWIVAIALLLLAFSLRR